MLLDCPFNCFVIADLKKISTNDSNFSPVPYDSNPSPSESR